MVLLINLCSVNTFAAMSDEAKPISLNSAVTDNLPTARTVKYYKVELPSPGKVNISFNHPNIERSYVYWKITMFDSEERIVLYLESTGNNTTGKSMNAYLDKGIYYIRVTDEGYWHSNVDYSLCVNFTENLGEYEIEPNNDKESATVISEMNKPVTGNLRVKGDVDYYQLTLSTPGKVNISFNHPNIERSYVYWKITMFDSVENEVLYMESTGSNPTGKSMNAYLDKGTYYIRVTDEGYWHSNVDYSLCVNFTENLGEFEIEQNNSIEDATLITEMNKPITGNLRLKSDVDYYKFTMPNSGKVYLGFNHGNLESTFVYWKVSMYDINNNKLCQLNSKGTDTVGKSEEIDIEKGTYYVKVEYEGYWHSNSDYTLSINVSGDEVPNNSEIKVLLNGKQIQFDQPPIIDNGRTLVPLRAIFEAMNATVSWEDKTRTVTANKGDTTVVMVIGNKVMTKNEKEIVLDVPPQIVNGRTLVPARAVAESFGAKVDWDGNTKSVIITQ
ncbi:MAG: copper amine oxidase N-terminal domain-containing protein [Clostridiaceae bacterium]|nr:copper amine oxidase N-terminal domain-containing protein [Clostridiaceae bacterium]